MKRPKNNDAKNNIWSDCVNVFLKIAIRDTIKTKIKTKPKIKKKRCCDSYNIEAN